MLGAEVLYFEGISRVEQMRELRIQGTNLLLLEMQMTKWTDRVIDSVLDMNLWPNTTVVLAHIERFMSLQKKGVFDYLRDNGVLMQVNASFFGSWLSRRRAMSMLRKDRFQLIGSDCHNLTTRKPNWDLVPEEAIRTADQNAKSLLGQAIHP